MLDQWDRIANATLEVRVNALPEVVVLGNIIANPGIVPINLSAHDPDGIISLYEWDQDDDGTFENNSIVPLNLTLTFHEPGDFNVTFRVTDNSGARVITIINVHINHPPVIRHDLEFESLYGKITLHIRAMDPDGEIVAYLWDLDGNGVPELETAGNTTTVFLPPGEHPIKVLVRDNMGLMAETQAIVIVGTSPELDIKVVTDEGLPLEGPGINFPAGEIISLMIEVKGTFQTPALEGELFVYLDNVEIFYSNFTLLGNMSESFKFNFTPTAVEQHLNISVISGSYSITRNLTIEGISSGGSHPEREVEWKVFLAAAILMVLTGLVAFFMVCKNFRPFGKRKKF